MNAGPGSAGGSGSEKDPGNQADDDPIADLVAGTPVPRRARPRVLVAVVVVTVVVVGSVLGWVVTRQESGYDDASRERFVEACSAGGGEPVRAVCECFYEGIVATIPYERFVEVDRALRPVADEGGQIVLPPEFDAIRADCARRLGPTD